MAEWQRYLDENQARFQAELLEFLRIPSVSALPDRAGDVEHAAVWVADRMRAAGIEHVEIFPTAGHPVVCGDWRHASGKPTILIYGHFDTQPADPVELWDSPPFQPVVKEGRVYARGSTDDKGNMLIPILSVEALLKTGSALPVNVRFIFEGQEEIGSPQIPAFVAAHRDRLLCDVVVSADGSQWGEDQPALWVGCKGLCGLQIDVQGAAADLHSGTYGGAVQNPIHALAQILASMRDPRGRICVNGFYNDVIPLTDADRESIAAVPFDESAYKKDLDVDDLFGEAGYSPLERAWARPTLEVNGIWGGFQGDGVKTVLPSSAHAKITCRLVAEQIPDRVLDAVEAHVREHAPPGVRIVIQRFPASARPYRMPVDHPDNRIPHGVLTEMYGKEPYYIRTGGTVPVYRLFLDELGVYTVTFAFGLEDERLHAPNEFFRLSSFQRGQRAYCRLLEEWS